MEETTVKNNSASPGLWSAMASALAPQWFVVNWNALTLHLACTLPKTHLHFEEHNWLLVNTLLLWSQHDNNLQPRVNSAQCKQPWTPCYLALIVLLCSISVSPAHSDLPEGHKGLFNVSILLMTWKNATHMFMKTRSVNSSSTCFTFPSHRWITFILISRRRAWLSVVLWAFEGLESM